MRFSEPDPRKLFQRRPSSEHRSMVWLTRAGMTAKQYDMATRIGIESSVDKSMLSWFLARKLLATRVYNTNWALSSPSVADKAETSPIDDAWRRAAQEAEVKIKTYQDNKYKTPEEKQYARTIELAINDLVARSTADGAEGVARVTFTEEVLLYWGERWKPEIEKYRNLRTPPSIQPA